MPARRKAKASGDVPAGFPDGKVNGRVYFIRMKQDSGSWNENDEGVKRLLNFLNQILPLRARKPRHVLRGDARAFLE